MVDTDTTWRNNLHNSRTGQNDKKKKKMAVKIFITTLSLYLSPQVGDPADVKKGGYWAESDGGLAGGAVFAATGTVVAGGVTGAILTWKPLRWPAWSMKATSAAAIAAASWFKNRHKTGVRDGSWREYNSRKHFSQDSIKDIKQSLLMFTEHAEHPNENMANWAASSPAVLFMLFPAELVRHFFRRKLLCLEYENTWPKLHYVIPVLLIVVT